MLLKIILKDITMTISKTPQWINDYNRSFVLKKKNFNIKIEQEKIFKRPKFVMMPEIAENIGDNPQFLNNNNSIKFGEKYIPLRPVDTTRINLITFEKILNTLGIQGGKINEELKKDIDNGHGEKSVYPHYLSATAHAYANMLRLQSKNPRTLHKNISKLAGNEIFIRGNNAFAPKIMLREGFANLSVTANPQFSREREKRLQEISAGCLVEAGYIKADDTVLDVGCGLGDFSKKLNESHISTVSIEPSIPDEQTPSDYILPKIRRQKLNEYLSETGQKHSVVYVGNISPLNSFETFIGDVHQATTAQGKAIIGIASTDEDYIFENDPDRLKKVLQAKFKEVKYISAKNIDPKIFERDGAIGGQIGFFIAQHPKHS